MKFFSVSEFSSVLAVYQISSVLILISIIR
jgi:hypothetical protein